MSDVELAVRELRQILDSHRTAPEWRWNARRRLAAARASLGAAPAAAGSLPTQRLDALATGVLDELDAVTIERQVDEVLQDLLSRGGGIRTRG